MSGMLPPLILELRAKSGQVLTAFGEVTEGARKMAADTDAATAHTQSGMTTLGRGAKAALLGVTGAAVVVGAESAKLAADFQAHMTLLQTAAGETASGIKVVSSGILDLATKTGVSVDQLSEGAYTVEKAGYRGADAINVLKAASEGAVAENVDLGIATNALTSIMMSYHLKASDAVATQNQLVAASGLAKTTMQEYAGSLSTVLPVASAAGISFAQVGGAIATLTQHGTSADEATQELANTIRNLQAPNQVASKAMQQLGINVTDVSKNLGQRGLTGTINLITDAIGQHLGPAGLVVVDTFKKSQSASADLNTMLGKMPPKLAQLSQSYLTGKMGLLDYQKAVKDMGGPAAAMGLQFLSLAKSSQGFNDLLKSGSPQAQTFAADLKTVMGGATGMNTALMLGGENMAYFQDATNKVSAAAKNSGSDISTWAQTQANATVQLHQLQQQAHVAGIELGTGLLPAMSALLQDAQPLIHGVSDLAKGFADASPQTQRLTLDLVVAGAAIVPLVSVSRKLYSATSNIISVFASGGAGAVRFVQGLRQVETAETAMASTSYTAGMKVGNVFSSISTSGVSMGRYVKTAFSNAGSAISNARGAFSEAETFGGKLGAIGSGAAGAAGALGPLAIGVAGVGAAVVGGIAIWDHYKAQQEESKQAVDDLTQSIEKDNGALGDNTRATMVNILQKQGLYEVGQKLGINQNLLTDAAMGNSAAMAAVNQQISDVQNSFTSLNGTQNAVAGSASRAGGAFNNTGNKAVDLQKAITTLQSALGTSNGQIGQARSSAANYAAAMGNATTQTSNLMSASDALSAELDKQGGNAISTSQAALQLQASEQQLAVAVKQAKDAGDANATSLDGNTAAGNANAQAINNMMQQAIAHSKAVYAQTQNVGQATAALSTDEAAILKSAAAAGLNTTAVQAMITGYHLVPGKIFTAVSVDTTPADERIHAFRQELQMLSNGVVVPIFTTTYSDGHVTKHQGVGEKATGGYLNTGWTTVGEQGIETIYFDGQHQPQVFSGGSPQTLRHAEPKGGSGPGGGGTTVNNYVTAQTNASASQIAAEIGWQLRQLG